MRAAVISAGRGGGGSRRPAPAVSTCRNVPSCRVPRGVLILVVAAGCAKEREPAPTRMEDLARFLFANWDDPELLPEAVDNLGRWIDQNVDTDAAEDGLELDPLVAADVADVEHPDAPLSALLGVAGEARSAFRVEDHAGYLVLADQTFLNPGQYKRYDRTIVAGDPERFPTGADEVLRTVNELETSSLGVSIPYTLLKDYRWVEGETERAIVARAWVEERSCNDGGGNCVEQSFSVDLWYADGARASQRMTASWSDVETSIEVGHDLMIASLAIGIQNVFRACEDFLAEGR